MIQSCNEIKSRETGSEFSFLEELCKSSPPPDDDLILNVSVMNED